MAPYPYVTDEDENRPVGIILNIIVIAIVAGLCILTNHIYRSSGDWVRTLWYNYDFGGENKKIHNLYLGSPGSICTPGEEFMNDFPGENDCNLMNSEQSMEDSYYLLQKADKRYALSNVYLGIDCWYSVYEIRKSDLSYIEKTVIRRERLTEKEESYFRKVMEYCAREKLSLAIRIFLPEEAAQSQEAGIFIGQIEEIVQEYDKEGIFATVDVVERIRDGSQTEE